MKKRLLGGILAISMLTMGLVGCGSGQGSSGDSDEIVIGAIGPLSGGASTYGQSVKNGAQVFLDKVNANGGINGKQVVLKFEDDEADPTKAINAYDKLVNQDGVELLLGPVTSGAANAVGPNATADGVPMITPSGTETNLTTTGGEYVFRTCYIDATQGEVIAKYATENLGAKTMAVLYNKDSDYSIGIAEAAKAQFEENGGSVVEYVSYNEGDKDFSAQLTNIKGSNPDILVLPDYYSVVGVIADQARKIGITSQLMGGDGWDSPELVKIGGDAVEDAVFVNHYSPNDTDATVQEFVNSYKEKYGQTPDAFAALSYSTLQLFEEAITKSGSTDGEAVKEALKNIDVDTISGNIKFDENRNPQKSVSIIKIENGEAKLETKVNP
ncbi:Leucine-%2C isoleucine-%2C valine-%2C threonine-%2C and alanine-binding protein precursor [uncultured Clostridium sp.]|uniref:ABC transporter substrate-binding protein n=1 Tax=uncultured Clostridium sp. TaxID=59620 RepID=UPI000820BEB5|nr:ABC transporter substrate-binding protein [uncultured Clostridium sp.]SCJ33870.1 Leucine-%2C isoleucine-%2C valine-%2C threonine-%2C and alanine-binding protein precursor [uncultured Clostridium sp.]